MEVEHMAELSRNQVIAIKDALHQFGVHSFATNNMAGLWVAAFAGHGVRLVDDFDQAVEMLVEDMNYGRDVRERLRQL